MEKLKEQMIYYCDHNIGGCSEKSWLGKGFDWKMCEIVFGVHPRIAEERKPVAVIQKKFHFCGTHSPIYKAILYALIIKKVGTDSFGKKVSHDPYLVGGLGCWITVHDCLSHEPIHIFQMSYDYFEKIYLQFPSFGSTENRDYWTQTIEDLRKHAFSPPF